MRALNAALAPSLREAAATPLAQHHNHQGWAERLNQWLNELKGKATGAEVHFAWRDDYEPIMDKLDEFQLLVNEVQLKHAHGRYDPAARLPRHRMPFAAEALSAYGAKPTVSDRADFHAMTNKALKLLEELEYAIPMKQRIRR